MFQSLLYWIKSHQFLIAGRSLHPILYSVNTWRAKMSISDRLRQIMLDNKLNMKEFSLNSGIPYRSLQDYLLSKRTPGTDAVVKICTHFSINLNWLLTGKGSMYQIGEEKAEYKKRNEIEKIREWLKLWWNKADERERYWLSVQMERTFPEYKEWLDKQGF